jgi:hypothetical protein
MTEKEVHHFGIPSGAAERRRTTAVQPFSFEERDKLLLKKKEETIQRVRLETYERTTDSEMLPVIFLTSVLPHLHIWFIKSLNLRLTFFSLKDILFLLIYICN